MTAGTVAETRVMVAAMTAVEREAALKEGGLNGGGEGGGNGGDGGDGGIGGEEGGDGQHSSQPPEVRPPESAFHLMTPSEVTTPLGPVLPQYRLLLTIM